MTENAYIIDNSQERVALELMSIIAEAEYNEDHSKEDAPREYYLKLYAQCISTVSRKKYTEAR